MRRYLPGPNVLLPLMIFIGVLIFGLRVSDLWDQASSGRLFGPAAHAETKTDTAPPTATSALAPAIPTTDTAKPAEAGSPPPNGTENALVPPPDEDVSPAEMEVLKQLSTRRDELDKRARQLDTREQLIKVAEQRVDQKIKEMDTLRLQLQSMVNQVSETQAAQLDNLVKVYETMKPEDAARIFETLDMPILLNVIQRMKPKSTAPIMAKMAPDKAKDLTVALTKQDQLPQVK